MQCACVVRQGGVGRGECMMRDARRLSELAHVPIISLQEFGPIRAIKERQHREGKSFSVCRLNPPKVKMLAKKIEEMENEARG